MSTTTLQAAPVAPVAPIEAAEHAAPPHVPSRRQRIAAGDDSRPSVDQAGEAATPADVGVHTPYFAVEAVRAIASQLTSADAAAAPLPDCVGAACGDGVDMPASARDTLIGALLLKLQLAHKLRSLATRPFLGASPDTEFTSVVDGLHAAAVEEAARVATAKAAEEASGKKRWAKGTGYGFEGYDDGEYDDEWWGEGRQDSTSIIPQAHRDRIAALNDVTAAVLELVVVLVARSSENAGSTARVLGESSLRLLVLSYLGSTETQVLEAPRAHAAVYALLDTLARVPDLGRHLVEDADVVWALCAQAEVAADVLSERAATTTVVTDAPDATAAAATATHATAAAATPADAAVAGDAGSAGTSAAATAPADAGKAVAADASAAGAPVASEPAAAEAAQETGGKVEEPEASAVAAAAVADADTLTEAQAAVLRQLVDLHACLSARAEAARGEKVLAVEAPGDAVKEVAAESELPAELLPAQLHAMYESTVTPLALSTKGSVSVESHHYKSAIEAAKCKVSKTCLRRVRSELRSLRHALPVVFGSSVLLRADKARPYIMEALIFAPEGTPYDSGAFLFDIYCPPEYPSVPPQVNLRTTGGGSVRFNPNLYECGKVCLSILGTWPGAEGENWGPDSTLLQVLVSIQALIFVEQPYFNEPGEEANMHTEHGKKMARTSSNGGLEVVRRGNIRHAMLGQLSDPPVGFEDAVHAHFRLKRAHILRTARAWLADAEEFKEESKSHLEFLAKLVTRLEVALVALGANPGEAPPRVAPVATGPTAGAGAGAGAGAAPSASTGAAATVEAAAAAAAGIELQGMGAGEKAPASTTDDNADGASGSGDGASGTVASAAASPAAGVVAVATSPTSDSGNLKGESGSAAPAPVPVAKAVSNPTLEADALSLALATTPPELMRSVSG